MKIFEYEKEVKQDIGKKFLVLSDIHVVSDKDIKKILNLKKTILSQVTNCSYDAILLVGDVIDATNVLRSDSKIYGELLNLIKFLGEVAPTYVAFGAHDMCYFDKRREKNEDIPWVPDVQVFEERLKDKISGFTNLKVFNNGMRDIGDGYTISIFNPILDYDLGKKDGDDKKLLSSGGYEFLNNLDSSQTNILLCHYPKVVLSLYREGILNNVDVSVSGHTHNGMTQLRVFPMETLLNMIGQKNRGIITPSKSFKFDDTKYLRGKIQLNEEQDLIINPAFISLAECAGILHYLDWMFYRGMSEINLKPVERMRKI